MSPIRTALTRIWTRDSSILLGGFFVTVILIIYIWWPLAEEYFAYVDWKGEWWRYIDWLLIGIFGFMSITIDRKSTRLNSSHSQISYAVFCLKKKIKS